MNAPLFQSVHAHERRGPLAQSLERRRLRTYLLMILIDCCLLMGSFCLAGWAYLDFRPLAEGALQAQLLLPLYLTLALYQRAYSIRALADWHYAARHAVVALGIAAALLIFVTFFAKTTEAFSRGVFSVGLLLAGLSITASRALLASQIRQRYGPSAANVLFVEAGGPSLPIRHSFRVDAIAAGIRPDPGDPHAFDRLGRLMLNMDRVVVSCPLEDRVIWAQVLRAAGVRGELVTDRLEELAPIGLAVEPEWRALIVSTGPLGLQQRAIKRLFDLAMSVGGLIVLSPLMLAVALAIRLEDGGPVFFHQRRMGRGNRFFDVLKFRSMRVERSDRDGAQSAAPDDNRITRVGRLIRRTSIDELPQLINVARGEMSMVGPRPHALGSQAGDKLFWEVDHTYWHRHSLKPGITGLAQVRGLRGATDTEKDLALRLEADLEYIRNWSPLRDTVIVLRTLGVLVHHRAF